MNWYLKVLNQYADFNGRARRREYWMFTLFNMIFAIVALILDYILGLAIEGVGYGLLYGLYTLAVLIPGLAVAVRRLHDIGNSGWMILIGLIPIVGTIWLLILLTTESDSAENKYDAKPKGVLNEEYTTNESTSDTIVLIVVIWMFVTRLFYSLMTIINSSYFSEEWFKPVSAFISLVWAVIPIGLALTVKDKTKQVLLFVLGGIYLAYNFYETVILFIRN